MTKQQLEQLFPNLENELYDELISHTSIREIKEGATLLRVGENIRFSFLMIKGLVKVLREDDKGRELFVYLIKPGKACIITLVCAMTGKTSKFFAKAVTDSLILTIPLQHADNWMKKYKSWQQFVIRSYEERFEELLQVIDEITFSNMDERLSFYLRKQAAEFGAHLKLTHHEIANDLNSSREVISRLLKKMEARNLLTLHRNSIEMLKPANITSR